MNLPKLSWVFKKNYPDHFKNKQSLHLQTTSDDGLWKVRKGSG